jgi:hypothetical protein
MNETDSGAIEERLALLGTGSQARQTRQDGLVDEGHEGAVLGDH